MNRYRTLFQVEIAHDYFLSRGPVVFEALTADEQASLSGLWAGAPALEIVPDAATQAVLRGLKMIFRAEAGGFFVAVQVDPAAPDLRPQVPPAADLALRFWLRPTDARFANYTELGPATTGFYRFGNDSQNAVAGTQFLSLRVPAFDTARRYVAGEAYAQASGATFDLFVALRDTGPSAAPVAADWTRLPADTFDATATYRQGAVVLAANRLFQARVNGPGTNLANAADWQPMGTLGNQYATVADATLPVSGLFNLDIADAALAQASVQVLRPGDPAAVMETAFVADGGTLADVQLDLRALRPGPYRLVLLDAARAVVPGHGLAIYVMPGAAPRAPFGVVEIGVGSGDFALFNPDGSLRAPRYVLRLLNRASRWRYIFPAAQAVGAGAEVAVEGGDDRILVTGAPRPLTRFGIGARLQADVAATPAVSEEILLPAPEANRIRLESAGWVSETYVANLTVGP